MTDGFVELIKEMQAKVEPAYDWIAYIVLDHSVPLGAEPVKERDGHGKLYARFNPSLLDAMRQETEPVQPYNPAAVLRSGSLAAVWGIPIHKRENMPDDWPEYDKGESDAR